MDREKKRVFVALSGGVDSSVAAALLQEQGYEITGVFIKAWHPDFLPCTWKEDRLDAMRVCAVLGIPFRTLDLSEVYKRDVVDYMIREYESGVTPNPDVVCNTRIKFGAFYTYARTCGAHYIATGHYAQKETKKKAHLVVSNDAQKDQTYFLWGITQEELQHTLFPVGAYTKEEVRRKAHSFQLPTVQKKDSQGLCFLGKLDMREFLKHYITPRPGTIQNTEGKIVGTHEGTFFYTLGQRHGLTITESGERSAYFVVTKNHVDNILTVAHDAGAWAAECTSGVVTCHSVNWISGEIPESGVRLHARVRYRGALFLCMLLHADHDQMKIEFDDPVPLVAAGQSIVLYTPERVCGGGIATLAV
jgi:tRNA-specific 2-thiouridylase